MLLAAAGIALIAAQELSLQIYLHTPCPADASCDKVISHDFWWGLVLIVLAGVVFVASRVIWPPSKTVTPPL